MSTNTHNEKRGIPDAVTNLYMVSQTNASLQAIMAILMEACVWQEFEHEEKDKNE